MNDGSGWGPTQAAFLVAAGIGSERLEAGSGITIQQSVANGFSRQTVIVGNVDDGTPLGQVDQAAWLSTALAQAREAEQHGAVIVECVNEPYLKGGKAEPAVYAAMYIALREAMVAAGLKIPLGWCTTGDYFDGATGRWSQMTAGNGWNADAIKAQPGLLGLVDCLVAHPYGAPHATNGEHVGPKGMEEQHAQLVALGLKHTDVYITEWGRNLDDVGGSEARQAADIKAAYEEFMALPYIKAIWYYQVRDDGTGKWGLVTTGTPPAPLPWQPRPSLGVVAAFAKAPA